MQEEPPEYVPSKKAKRRSEPDIKVSGPAPSTGPGSRRQSSAFPAGEEGASEVGGYADEDASEDEASRHGSVAPVAQQQPPFAGVAQPKTEDLPVGDPYALPGGSPALAATLSLPDNPLLGLASASAALLNSPFPPAGSPSLGTMLNGSSSPVLPVNGRPLPGNNPSAAPDASTTFHPRLVARHASASLARPPLVSRFELRCSPSGATYSLDNSSVRQHALAVPKRHGARRDPAGPRQRRSRVEQQLLFLQGQKPRVRQLERRRSLHRRRADAPRRARRPRGSRRAPPRAGPRP